MATFHNGCLFNILQSSDCGLLKMPKVQVPAKPHNMVHLIPHLHVVVDEDQLLVYLHLLTPAMDALL